MGKRSGGNAHDRAVIKVKGTDNVPSSANSLLNKAQITSDMKTQRSIWGKLLLFFEHPWITSALFTVGGLVGTLYFTPLLVLSVAGILLAFHRVGVVKGQRLGLQIVAYSVLVTVTFLGFYWVGHIIKVSFHIPTAQEIAVELGKRLQIDKPITSVGPSPIAPSVNEIKKPPFSVIMGTALASTGRDNPAIYLYSGRENESMAPVNLMTMINLTNLQSIDTIIAYFEVSLKADDGNWIPLTWVDPRGKKTYLAPNLRQGAQLDANYLIDSLASAIKPHETRSGWAYFEYPVEGVRFSGEYRVKVKDMAGSQFESNVQSSKSSSIHGAMLPIIGIKDLSNNLVKFR
jgi:hypothetical protein